VLPICQTLVHEAFWRDARRKRVERSAAFEASGAESLQSGGGYVRAIRYQLVLESEIGEATLVPSVSLK